MTYDALKAAQGTIDEVAGDVPAKAQIFGNIQLYSIYELWDAYYDFVGGTGNDNDGGVKALDESWTFYACADQQVGDSNGNCGYAQTEQMAVSYGQKGAAGVACEINTALVTAFGAMRCVTSERRGELRGERRTTK